MKSFLLATRNLTSVLIALVCISYGPLNAQTTLINPAAEGGFENGATFAANGWSFDNGVGITNTWQLGTVPAGFTNRSAFVSNDGGTSWNYTNSSISVVHFWRDVTFPAGQPNITLTFNWQALGETSSFDALMVSLAPTTYTPTASTTSLGTGVLAAPAVTIVQLWNAGGVQTANISIPGSLVGNCAAPVTARLIFTWKNDGSLGTAPPAAIDNISLVSAAPPAPLAAGTYKVGPTGAYTSLTNAANDVNTRGVTGPVILELQAAYTSAVETFPITLAGQNNCSPLTSTNTATIRPELGAPLLTIAGTNAGPTIDLNNGNWWRIDGRPGGAGTSKGLVISNNSTTGNAIRYINDASNNIVRYCDIQGVNTSTTSGVILFSTTTGTTGNDNNLIELNDIHDGATTPANCIISSGTTTSLNHFNSNNSIANNNIYNFFLSSSTSFGITLPTGATEWTITGNSFYQTVARVLAASQFSAVNITVTTSNNHTVSNNFIGGSAPLCGGAALTLTGAGNFRGVNMTVGAGTSQLTGNTVQNINLTTSNATNFNGAFVLSTGNFNVSGNTVGSLTSNGSIVVSASGTTFAFCGVLMGGTTPINTSTISNNNIGGINLTVTGAPASPGLIRGISIQGTAAGHNYIVQNNTVGSTTLANSIMADGNIAGSILGIVSFSNALGQQILNNTVSNLTGTNSGTANVLWGILCQGSASVATYTIKGNTVQNLSNGTGNSANVSLVGIQESTASTTLGSNFIEDNVVRNLNHTNTTVGTSLAGILVNWPTVTTNSVARNFVHSLNMATTTNTGTTTGIFLSAGSSTVANNMIRLGVDATGTGITSGFGMIGIFESAGNNNIHFNSVYIDGTGVSGGTTNTFALASNVTTGARNYFNNILYNARSNGAGTGKHYAIALGGTAPNPAGASSNYNDLLVTGTGGNIGLFNAVDQPTIASWRTATGQDFQSINADPQFIAPNGNSATVNLHINGAVPTPIESAGQTIFGINTDFDIQNRSANTPTDIGADAGVFQLLDIAPPGIGYTPLTNFCGTGNLTLSSVVITDGTGIPTAGALIPRIYYRKNAGAWFSQPGVQQSGNATNGVWNFTIVAADLGGVAGGDLVDYYVIAQDNLGNVGSNPGGVVAVNVNTVTTHPAVPNTITVIAALNGTYTVGVGGNYTTLTAAITDYNTKCIGGPIVFSLTDATYPTETFPITINANASANSTNTLTIKPAVGVNAAISGLSATALIVLNGADFVTINGSNGSGLNQLCPPSAATRNLTLTNTSTSTTSAVIWLQTVASPLNGASNNRILNCNISGNGPLQTLCGIGAGSSTIGTASLGTNNNFNFYINNNISNAQYGIISQGNSVFNKNTGNQYGLNLMNTAAPTNLATGGVFITFEDQAQIYGNQISGMSQTTSPDVCGILVGFTHSGLSSTTFNGNECSNIDIYNNVVGSVVNSGTFSAAGIAVASTNSGTTNIYNNTISGVAANGTSGDFSAGIMLGGGNGSTINVFHNTVSMQGTITGTSAASQLSTAFIVTNNAAPSNMNVRNNIFSNTQAGNTGATLRFAAATLAFSGATGNYAGFNSDFNDLYSAGPGPGIYTLGITGGSTAGNLRLTLANWRTETGRDLNSFSVQPNFVSATDLHLVTTTNQCLDAGGTNTFVSGDIDCQNRNATTPDIGADEFTNPNLTLTVTETSGIANNDNIICAGAAAQLTATGGGTYAWSVGGFTTASIAVVPPMTTTYTVTVTNGSCTDVMSTTITVIPVPGLSAVLTQPATCVSLDGAIDLTVSPAGTYTYDWADVAGTNNTEDRTGLMVGTYNVTVTNTATGCTSTASYILTGPGGCDVCPTIPNVSATPNPVCVNGTFSLTSTGLTNMGNTYGIIFKYFNAATGTPYTGGTVLATIPNASLTAGGTTATAAGLNIATPGTYFVYAILTPNPNDPACRPSAVTTLVVNNTPTASTTVSETSGIANNDGIICLGASVTITGTGGTSYAWSTGALTAAITVSPAATTTYTVTVTNAAGCTAVAIRTITVNPLPTQYNVVGGGGYCLPGPGVNVGLNLSQTGVNYQLQINGVNFGAPVAGTGGTISFGAITAVGTATVIGTLVATNCSIQMNGSVSVFSFNCNVTISDPCVCKNNATNLVNGQFDETIKVNAPSTQTWSVVTATGLYAVGSNPPPAAPTPIASGTLLTNLGAGMNMFELKGIHVDAIGYTLTVINNLGTTLTIGNSCTYPNPTIDSDLSGDFCLFSDPVSLTGTPGDNNIISQSFTVNGVPATQFDPSQGLGTYVITYIVDGGTPKAFGANDPGCIQKVSQTVHVIQTPAVLNCNDLIYVSLDASCVGEVKPDDILEGTYGCYDDYLVELDKTPPLGNGPWLPATLTTTDLGHTYQVQVTHKVSGNQCWGSVKIEDKIPPVLDCKDIRLVCPVTTYDPNYLSNVLNISTAFPTITDCSNYTSTYVDTWFDLPCGAGINGVQDVSAYVQRKWTATDQWGNSATCIQYLYFVRLHVTDVHFPPEVSVACGAGVNTDPSVTGAPYFTALGQNWPINPGAGFCEIQSAYVDQILPVCDGTYKILRTWTVLDWCMATSAFPPFTNPMYYIQLIKVTDDAGPQFTCPANTTVSIDAFDCCGTIDLPSRIIRDNCSRVNNIEGMVTTFDPETGDQTGMYMLTGTLEDFPGNNWWDLDTLGNWGTTPCLPIGSHVVTYRAQDDCSNVRSCTFKLTVADLVAPVASCDQLTQVALGVDGTADIPASVFDDGSYDHCCFDGFEVRRMDAGNCGSTSFDNHVTFCCDDIGDTLTVVLRANDCSGNSNECMVQVLVEDKIKPTCQSPANVTVTCEQFDPSLWLYGTAEALDNCCLDTITRTVNYNQFDTLCNRGTITRTFRAFDCSNNSSQCTQRIVVTYEQDYYVKFPNDVIVTVCDGTGNYGEPTFFGEDCELLGVSFEDEIFTVVPDACYKIERTWKIINWCTYNNNLGCINVPNPNPNATVNHPTNLPGPIVSPIQTVGDPWKSTIVKINPTDANTTNYSIYYDPNANCYVYKQIIKIVDTQDPVAQCPASPQTICDLTPNDPELWNKMYWWDNNNQSHDLCEAPSDICVTASDACSGANINIEYQLFLDLDGDGTMETVVNSTQLGSQPGGLGWNNILYGNVTGAGQPRQFDDRPVPVNQKWGFAIQETVVGNNKTACVKFNTFQSQNTYVTPQLPYGTHKIKWFISDGCGNETVCEYTIIVKDCKAPTVVCFNGLSVNIMPTGMITMWATDFLQYSEDNCTLNPYIKYGIRKCDPNGQNLGFPVDGNGNPITSVTFTCAELDMQCVELWAIDLAGNADFCKTFVLVQDNNDNCSTDHVTVSGALKTEAPANDGIEEATVELTVQDPMSGTTMQNYLSDDSGTYNFSSVPTHTNVTVTPVKDDNPLNGVTTYDLVLMSKHILGIEPLGTPYKMIAADANKSNSITTADIVEFRKLILGIYLELPNNTSWRFIDKAFSFGNPLNPFEAPFPENKVFPNIMASSMDEDFVGVKIGDVNNSAVPNSLVNAEDRSAGTVLFDVDNRDLKAGEIFEVTFRAAEKTLGYQMTLNLNGLEVIDLVSGDNVSSNNFGVHNNALTVSIDGSDAFTVKFRATKSGKLSNMMKVSSEITKAEAYVAQEGRSEVALRFDGKTIAGVGFELYQNQPNPFVNKTFVSFNLPEATTATLTVYDETGRTVYTQKGDFAKGYNTIALDRALLNGTGVLYYTLETATDSATKKMIQTK